MPKQSIDLHELFQQVQLEAHAAWRYRWHALVLAWCVMIVGALVVFSLPDKYAASAQVYADTDALTNPLLSGIAVHANVQDRLDVITRTLLSRPNLESVADKTGLSVRATSPADKDALLTSLAAAVQVTSAGAHNLYEITYTDSDPKMAQKVVQAFLQILMNDTLGQNSAATASAENFLQQQVKDYANRLDAADKKLADFKQANIGYIPSAGGGDYSTRLQEAEARLQDLELLQNAVGGSRGAVSERMLNPAIQQIDQQIAAYQQQLNNLLLKYTDQYPDVISAKRMIKQLESRRAALLAGGARARTVIVPQADAHSDLAGGRALAAQIAAKKDEIARLRANADKITAVQLTLQQLTRNYDITKKQYDELVSRLNTAHLSQDATQTGNNLKFRVISPPVVPLLPVSPKRGLLLLVVLLFAVGFGAAFGYFLHKIKPVFLNLKSLREFGPYPVIGTFTLIASRSQRESRHREVIGFSAGVCLLALMVLVVFVFDANLANAMHHVFVMGGT